MRTALFSLFVFCYANCQLFEKSVPNRIKCIVGKTSKRSQWKVKTCPPYSSYCVSSEIGKVCICNVIKQNNTLISFNLS